MGEAIENLVDQSGLSIGGNFGVECASYFFHGVARETFGRLGRIEEFLKHPSGLQRGKFLLARSRQDLVPGAGLQRHLRAAHARMDCSTGVAWPLHLVPVRITHKAVAEMFIPQDKCPARY